MSIVKQNSELYRRKLIDLLNNFEMYLNDGSLREQVLYLVPMNEILRNLGASLVEGRNITSARDRILSYLKKYKGIIVSGDELMVVLQAFLNTPAGSGNYESSTDGKFLPA